MDNRTVAIGIGILIIVLLEFLFFSNMTRNVITGSVVVGEKVDSEHLGIDINNENVGDNLNGVQNISG